VLAVSAAGCERCDPVTTPAKAFEISKRRLIEGHMKKIKELGGDTWIFEDSEVGDFGNPCNSPARFHFARRPWPEEFQVIWVAFVKGTCEECWDTITLSTSVSECGHFTMYPSSRKPNQSFVLRRPDQLSKGESGIQYTHYCGPTAGPHYAAPSQQ
jgi:hypothetical protein